ncbi:MAG: T9SS type A sorting domain-containing protein [Candidatus Poribacteria bacterium]|nr:T9SS type A sorting domain-containing protein [Candidatus Poribacteria bacterium]
MKHVLTLTKLTILLLAIGGVGFGLHTLSTAQLTPDFTDTTDRFDPRLITGPDLAPLEVGEPEPRTGVSPEQVHDWLTLLRAEHDGSLMFTEAIANLERLLNRMTPTQPALLPNYPNPFNPETWIPYHLETAADVSVAIYAADGKLVRTLALGHQEAGVYQSRARAAYWDGRNDIAERVASGVYFYTLTAGDFRATRKMLIVK